MNSCNNSFVVSNNCSDPTTNCELRPSNSFRFSTRIEYNKSQHFASPPNNNLESPAFVKLLGVFTWYLIIIYFTTQNGIMYSCFVITSIILVKKAILLLQLVLTYQMKINNCGNIVKWDSWWLQPHRIMVQSFTVVTIIFGTDTISSSIG